MRVEDLDVYQKLCQLHVDLGALTREWPHGENDNLGAQLRASSNSAAQQLALQHGERRPLNKVDPIARARIDALETIHHLFIAKLRNDISEDVYLGYRARYEECLRMLGGLERRYESHPPDPEPRSAPKP